MAPQPGQQQIAMHILLNNARSSGNQKIEFVLLTEYNNRNIFL